MQNSRPSRHYILLFCTEGRMIYFCCETLPLIMNKHVTRWKSDIEWQAFGVCTAIGERIGIATSRIRMWFIYISFLTLGSPLIIYMILAFWINMKNYIFSARRNPLRYL